MLTNDAFRELVQQGGKSTKEIAREAVEDEFERHTKKRKKGGDSSDDENDDEDDDDKKNTKKKHDKKKRNNKKYDKGTATTNEKDVYRDRAQERREGKVDSTEFASAPATTLSAEMTKYLGGDERHTHLVKGLDITLARRVKRDMGRLVDQQKLVTKQKQKPLTTTVAPPKEAAPIFPKTESEAKLMIQGWSSTTAFDDDPLSRSMLTFLQKKVRQSRDMKKRTRQSSAAGQALQRSSLTFSCVANPGDVRRAWEVPEEQIWSTMDNNNNNSNKNDGWWNVDLLDQLQKVFARNTSVLPTTRPSIEKEGASSEGDDDDDDIFADAGTYVPTAPSAAATSADETKASATHPAATVIGTSLFSGLFANEQKEDEEEAGMQEDGFALVAKLGQRAAKNKGNQSGDFSQFSGDYGEDTMDVDFSGQCEDDLEGGDSKDAKKKKKKKGEDTTTASKEYGQQGKPFKATED